jgi:hypothetical protein
MVKGWRHELQRVFLSKTGIIKAEVGRVILARFQVTLTSMSFVGHGKGVYRTQNSRRVWFEDDCTTSFVFQNWYAPLAEFIIDQVFHSIV